MGRACPQDGAIYQWQPSSGATTRASAVTNAPIANAGMLLAGVAVFMAGYQRDFRAQSEDPRLAVSWETAFQTLLKSAAVEEARRRAQSVAWQPYSPAPLASPARS